MPAMCLYLAPEKARDLRLAGPTASDCFGYRAASGGSGGLVPRQTALPNPPAGGRRAILQAPASKIRPE